jgi:ATP-dependent Lon protease
MTASTSSPPRDARLVPLLPLRDIIVFPHMVVPLFVGRERSINALEEAMNNDKDILLAAQKTRRPTIRGPRRSSGDLGHDHPAAASPRRHGEGAGRGQATRRDRSLHPNASRSSSSRSPTSRATKTSSVEVEALHALGEVTFETYVKLNKKIPPEMLDARCRAIDDPSMLADTIAAHLTLKLEQKQELLEMVSPRLRLERLYELMQGEIEILQVEKKIRSRVKKQMERTPEGVLPQRADAGDPEGARRARRVQERDQRARGARKAPMSKEAREGRQGDRSSR